MYPENKCTFFTHIRHSLLVIVKEQIKNEVSQKGRLKREGSKECARKKKVTQAVELCRMQWHLAGTKKLGREKERERESREKGVKANEAQIPDFN